MATLVFLLGCKDSDTALKGNYALDDNSVVEWKGTMENGFNNGSFDIAENHIEVEKGQIKAGEFVIRIASIKNFNQQEPAVREQLLTHLKSDAFFNLARYPEASFKITSVNKYAGNMPDAIANANFVITGDFSMLGKTNQISFAAAIKLNGNKLEVEADFMIDRTRWGMDYASDPAAEMFIHHNVGLHFKLMGYRQAGG
ncbi:YceI family protein [Pedobacter heparinus]|uniref:YceI family protein n=1 Tax=Pedobacter heparinus TaxID=984 RepID=UPI0029306990|nr:YceI family protein [Pedobacter heparinus]